MFVIDNLVIRRNTISLYRLYIQRYLYNLEVYQDENIWWERKTSIIFALKRRSKPDRFQQPPDKSKKFDSPLNFLNRL